MPLSPLASAYDQFILDLDGSVGIGDRPTPRAVEAVEALRDAGKQVAFATNDPRSGTEDYVARLWKLGIRASLRDVVTVGGALQHLLAGDALGPHRLRDRDGRAASARGGCRAEAPERNRPRLSSRGGGGRGHRGADL